MNTCVTCKWWKDGEWQPEWQTNEQKKQWKFCSKHPTEPYCLNNYTCFDNFCDEWELKGDMEVNDANRGNGK